LRARKPRDAQTSRSIRTNLLASGYADLPVTSNHGAAVGDLTAIHKDPFDRLLVAQARCEGITLLTSDTNIARYPGPIRLVPR
jgi:PIN domain nuclease of toxin-antitoxin system